jgi:ankyrin repeat protein
MKNWQSEVLEATIQQNISILKEIFLKLEDSDKRFTTNEGKNLLHFVSDKKTENTLPLIQFLLNAGIDPQALDENFESALDIAKKNNNIPALTLMKHFVNKRNQEIQNYN